MYFDALLWVTNAIHSTLFQKKRNFSEPIFMLTLGH